MRFLRWCGGFFEVNTQTSMTRLLAFLIVLITAVAVWKGRDAATVAALIGGGAVALMARTKPEP